MFRLSSQVWFSLTSPTKTGGAGSSVVVGSCTVVVKYSVVVDIIISCAVVVNGIVVMGIVVMGVEAFMDGSVPLTACSVVVGSSVAFSVVFSTVVVGVVVVCASVVCSSVLVSCSCTAVVVSACVVCCVEVVVDACVACCVVAVVGACVACCVVVVVGACVVEGSCVVVILTVVVSIVVVVVAAVVVGKTSPSASNIEVSSALPNRLLVLLACFFALISSTMTLVIAAISICFGCVLPLLSATDTVLCLKKDRNCTMTLPGRNPVTVLWLYIADMSLFLKVLSNSCSMELARFLYSVEDWFDSSGVKLSCSLTLPEKVVGTPGGAVVGGIAVVFIFGLLSEK